MSVSTRTIETIDPATGGLLRRYEPFPPAQIEAAVGAAARAQEAWRDVSAADRAALLRAVADLLRSRGESYAALITVEMGKPLAEARAEVDKCARCCDFYAESGPALLADRHVATDAAASFVRYEPLGVVLAIMPWNFPFWQVVRFAAPALLAGNGGLLKHAPNVSGCALALERLFLDAGAPAGLFAALMIGDDTVTEATARLLEDPRIAAVTLTGSERAGASVAAAAGRALKKSVLELGGSDPFVVLADADGAAVARLGARARFLNGGQSCIAAKRFILVEEVADAFEAAFAAEVAALRVGNPTDPDVDVGPLARADLLDALERQVSASVAAGARLVIGGERLEGPGAFFAPTVLADVDPSMAVFREETFGPVAAVVRAADDDEAVALANDTPYGLGASVWTGDVAHGQAVGARIRSGALFINAIVASDPRLPFGGTRRSGYGRELAGEGLHEFTNVRTIWVGPDDVSTATAPRSE
jgi:succinate-semialdehyde dehydrogenase/glutarate-semialdehyde dehydrogenase